jgi:hypothetical protein
MGVGVTALWVQWVGIEVKHAGKMKLGDRKDVWHMQEMEGWKKTVIRSGDLGWSQVKDGGVWESQGWHRKETAILRAVGVFRGSHMGTEKGSNAEGGVQMIRS